MDLGAVLVASLTRLELADRLLELRDCPREEPRQLACGLGDGRDPVQVGRVSNLLDVVEDIVQTGREGVNIFVVERGNEGPVKSAYDFVGEFVTLALKIFYLLLTCWKVCDISESPLEQAG